MKKPWLQLSAGALLIFFLGIVTDKWVRNWPLVALKFEVDVFAAFTALLSIGVTLLVAYWVSTVLEKRNTEGRTEKDIIIKHIDLMYPIIEDAREKVKSGAISYTHAASLPKRLNMNTASVVLCMVNASLQTSENHEALIQAEVLVLRSLMTNTVLGDTNLVVVDGIITISAPRQLLIEVQMDKIRNEIFKFELAVNNA